MEPWWTSVIHAVALIAFVSYFSSLFYILSVLVLHRQALARWEPDRTVLTKQYTQMAQGVSTFGAWPALVLLLLCGGVKLFRVPGALVLPWVQAALGLTALLVVYHVATQRIRHRLARQERTLSSIGLRVWSFGATLLLIAFAVVLTLRDLEWYYGVLGLVVLGAVVVMVLGLGRKKDDTDAASGKPGA